MSAQRLTNASLRQRFGIETGNAAQVSRLIKEALAAKVIRMFDVDTRLQGQRRLLA
jgi:ATP-dependent DNA helicase RecG